MSAGKPPQAILDTKHMEVEQQANPKATHARIDLRLHFMSREQRRNRIDFQDDGFVRQDIRTKSEPKPLVLIDRRNADFAPHPHVAMF